MKKKMYTIYCGECDTEMFEGEKVECEAWMKNEYFEYGEDTVYEGDDELTFYGCCIDCSRALS